MLTPRDLIKSAELAKAIEHSPKRTAELKQYYGCLMEALNSVHVEDEQDGLCLIEAIARVLAHAVGGLPDKQRFGALTYVAARAEMLRPSFALSGALARLSVEGDELVKLADLGLEELDI